MYKNVLITNLIVLLLIASCQNQAGESYTNSLGNKMIRIEPGAFQMGDLMNQG